MKRNLLIAALILLILSVSAWTQSSKPQWEYRRVFSPADKKLNEVAGEGWELVTVDNYSNYIFKRQK